ncbi:GH25 family lysozyme [Butyrivibrio sp. YAB3001]|uniref:GH25 family lysozyme n=1 Tax=Butyrivibrio sp. YAB3001 TaxID=1520812 RepID=UPI0008F680D4|nr:GH25 family lysozyme [Butyrivibrio sp. YAB3001]SFC20627.1 Putative cell wall binding repeat-containing protein [Butyrivibrio sp. YAB3001]
MFKKFKGALCSLGALAAAIAFLSLSPIASVNVEARGPEIAMGIDVSKYQGAINWQQVKNSGVQFAMIRVGTTKKGIDEQFVNNIVGANAAGVRAGVYIYSYATTPEQAAAEANQVLAWIGPYTVSFPIAIDIEDSSQKGLNAAQLQAIADTFCSIISANGYEPMVYASKNWFTGRMPVVSAAKWVAQYSSSCEYAGDYAMWQSTSHGSVAGVPSRVDVNHLYTDYFSRLIPEGFNSYGGNIYYYHNYKKMYGWLNLSNGRYHADANGVINAGWFQDETGIYYLDPAQGGLAKVGFADIDGARYYFDGNGVRRTGLIDVGGAVCYANEDGVCQKGLIPLNDGVHYFDDQYLMHIGLTQVGDNLYFFNENGVMQTGMLAFEIGKYMFAPDGTAVSGWYADEKGQKYFFGADHKAYVGLQTIENSVYLFGADGVMFTGWTGEAGSKYYFAADGRMVTGWNAIDGKAFYFGADGNMVSGLASLKEGVYYLDPTDGHMVVGWVQLPDGWRYFDANNGKMLAKTTAVLDNVECTFDKNGLLTTPAGWAPGTPLPAAQTPAEAAPAVTEAAPAQANAAVQ